MPLEECPVFHAAGLIHDTRIFNLLRRAALTTRQQLLKTSFPGELQSLSRLMHGGGYGMQGGLGTLGLKAIDHWRTMLISCAGVSPDGQSQIRPELMAEAAAFMDEYHGELAELAAS
jgi:hypothetical protein